MHGSPLVGAPAEWFGDEEVLVNGNVEAEGVAAEPEQIHRVSNSLRSLLPKRRPPWGVGGVKDLRELTRPKGTGVRAGFGRPPKAARNASPPQAGKFGILGVPNPSAYIRFRQF